MPDQTPEPFSPPDPRDRFSSRVDDYVRHRPGYPAAAVETLRQFAGLVPGCVVADIGAGTGIFSRLLLEAGARVCAIEPNAAMRAALASTAPAAPHLTVSAGSAESTGLPDDSVDLITAAQAFHWFVPDQARLEFARILKPDGRVALVWNNRLDAASPFLVEYDQLLHRFATDYATVDHRKVDQERIARFFAPGEVRSFAFPNRQVFDFAGLRGRLLSSSYAPPTGHPRHESMLVKLHRIFERHQSDGRVAFLYRTELHVGRFGPG